MAASCTAAEKGVRCRKSGDRDKSRDVPGGGAYGRGGGQSLALILSQRSQSPASRRASACAGQVRADLSSEEVHGKGHPARKMGYRCRRSCGLWGNIAGSALQGSLGRTRTEGIQSCLSWVLCLRIRDRERACQCICGGRFVHPVP